MPDLRAGLTDLFTEQDNSTWCPLRLCGIPFAFVATAVYMGLSIYTVAIKGNPLDYVSFGTGLSILWGTVSAAIIGKAKWTEGCKSLPQ
ncbi:MAG: hypothetical protein IRY96_00460 [Burkholderiales bacterium]|nr:hypothetical protein [Burkholderiales bacterium]